MQTPLPDAIHRQYHPDSTTAHQSSCAQTDHKYLDELNGTNPCRTSVQARTNPYERDHANQASAQTKQSRQSRNLYSRASVYDLCRNVGQDYYFGYECKFRKDWDVQLSSSCCSHSRRSLHHFLPLAARSKGAKGGHDCELHFDIFGRSYLPRRTPPNDEETPTSSPRERLAQPSMPHHMVLADLSHEHVDLLFFYVRPLFVQESNSLEFLGHSIYTTNWCYGARNCVSSPAYPYPLHPGILSRE